MKRALFDPAASLAVIGVLAAMSPAFGAEPSFDCVKAEGANASFWEHHGEAALTWFGKELSCKVR